MNIVRWQPRTLARTSPLRDLDTLPTDFDHLLDWALGGTSLDGWGRALVPAMDVVEEENRYLVRADLPGLTRDDIEITYKDGILTLQGEKKQTEQSKSGRFYCRERFEGKFGRNLRLPEKVDVNKIEANFKDGVLELILPFSPESQPRKIEISK